MTTLPGTIGLITSDLLRYPEILTSIVGTRLQSQVELLLGTGPSIVNNLNKIVQDMSLDSEWLWLMGDDHEFSPTVLQGLLNADVDIVVPLCANRRLPYNPVLFRYDQTVYTPYQWHEFNGKSGLQEVDAAGSAGMLIRRKVLETIEYPWFETGKLGSAAFNEDLYFCKKAREHGYKVFVHLDIHLGHAVRGYVYPYQSPDLEYGYNLALDAQHQFVNLHKGE